MQGKGYMKDISRLRYFNTLFHRWNINSLGNDKSLKIKLMTLRIKEGRTKKTFSR